MATICMVMVLTSCFIWTFLWPNFLPETGIWHDFHISRVQHSFYQVFIKCEGNRLVLLSFTCRFEQRRHDDQTLTMVLPCTGNASKNWVKLSGVATVKGNAPWDINKIRFQFNHQNLANPAMAIVECYFPLCSMKINRINFSVCVDNCTYSQPSGFRNIWTQWSHKTANRKKEKKSKWGIFESLQQMLC